MHFRTLAAIPAFAAVAMIAATGTAHADGKYTEPTISAQARNRVDNVAGADVRIYFNRDGARVTKTLVEARQFGNSREQGFHRARWSSSPHTSRVRTFRVLHDDRAARYDDGPGGRPDGVYKVAAGELHNLRSDGVIKLHPMSYANGKSVKGWF